MNHNTDPELNLIFNPTESKILKTLTVFHNLDKLLIIWIILLQAFIVKVNNGNTNKNV